MEKNLICKLILFSYKSFEYLCENTDEKVKRIAVSTMHGKDVFKAFDEITKLMNEKRTYCNLKVMCDEIFEKMQSKDILVYYCIQNLSADKISDLTGLDKLKIRYKLSSQIRSFCTLMLKKYAGIQLLDAISESKTLLMNYRKILKKYNQKVGRLVWK